MSEVETRCLCRKHAITSLRCSRCSSPICPNCSVSGFVGSLCKPCFKNHNSALENIPINNFLIALPLTLLGAIFGGWLLATLIPMGVFILFVSYLYGLGVGEIAIRSIGRRKGWKVQLLSGLSTFIGLVVGILIHTLVSQLRSSGIPNIDEEVGLSNSNTLLIIFLTNPWTYAAALLAIFGSVQRVKNF